MNRFGARRSTGYPGGKTNSDGEAAPVLPRGGWRRWLPAVLSLGGIAGYLLALARLLPLGAEDFGVAGVFSTDEALSGQVTRRMLRESSLNPSHFFSYGALYHELAALLLLPFGASATSERAVLIGLRALSLLAAGATLALTGLLAARLFGRWAGLLAAALLACSSELARWSITAHPDTLQLALITGSLLVTTRVREEARRRDVALAALLAGLAFGTKYLGLLALPLLAVALLAGRLARGEGGGALARRLAGDALLAGAVFFAAFALSNPYALIEWRRFITQARGELAQSRGGHLLRADDAPVRWLGRIGARSFAGPLLPPAALVGGVAAFTTADSAHAAAGRRWWRLAAGRLGAEALVALWTGGYLLYLLAAVRYQESRYALPLLPGMAVLASGLVARIARWSPPIGLIAAAMLVAVTAGAAVAPVRALSSERWARATNEEANPRITAGRWLRENFSPDTVILADAYVYLPPSLTRATVTFGLTEAQVLAISPDVIVTTEEIRGRFHDPASAERYIDGAAAYRARADAYDRLERGELDSYRPIKQFDSVRVYRRMEQ